VYGKLPPMGINTWIGFFAAISFILLFVALPFITKKDARSAK
jgi:ubiquinol-cytochrome c reductase cytochrome b subunit